MVIKPIKQKWNYSATQVRYRRLTIVELHPRGCASPEAPPPRGSSVPILSFSRKVAYSARGGGAALAVFASLHDLQRPRVGGRCAPRARLWRNESRFGRRFGWLHLVRIGLNQHQSARLQCFLLVDDGCRGRSRLGTDRCRRWSWSWSWSWSGLGMQCRRRRFRYVRRLCSGDSGWQFGRDGVNRSLHRCGRRDRKRFF